jgi:hypothetical protein
VLDTGEVMLASTATPATVRFVDPADGRQRRQVTVDLGELVDGLGGRSPFQLEVRAAGPDRLVVRASPTVEPGGGIPPRTRPLLLNLATAAAAPLPLSGNPAAVRIQAVNDPGFSPAIDGQWRDLLKADSGGELLAHVVQTRDSATATAIEIAEPATGRFDVVTTVTGAMLEILPRS